MIGNPGWTAPYTDRQRRMAPTEKTGKPNDRERGLAKLMEEKR